MTKQTRTDYYFSFDRTTAFKKTPEGFMQGRAVLTTAGVYPYRQADGSIRWELRPPEEVFKDATMYSLRGKPITNEHPTELVTPETYRDVAVGSIGDSIIRDDYNLVGFLTINDADAIAAIEKGKRGLSCGYTVKVITEDKTYDVIDWDGKPSKKTYPCPGVWNGVPYDAIQTEMENNHLSLVDRGRAGDAARIRVDGAMVLGLEPRPTHNPSEKEKNMKKLKLDNGLEYEVPPEVAVAFESTKEKIAALDSELATVKGDAQKTGEAHRAEIAAKDEKIATMQATIDGEGARVDAAIKSRAALLTAAAQHKIELKGDESAHQIRVAVLKKLRPTAKIDGESETFVENYFRIAMDEAGVDDGNRQDLSDSPAGGSGSRTDAADHATRRAAARQKMITGEV